MLNQIFNLQRFFTYGKYTLLVNWRKRALTAAGLIVALIVTLLFNLKMNRGYHLESIIGISGTIVLILVFANAFPSLRQKESTMHFLTIPASNTEKFIFELISRFFTLFVIYPALLKLIGNLTIKIFAKIEASTKGLDIPRVYELISFDKYIDDTFAKSILFIIAISIILFVGSTVFKKNPLLKTMLFIGAISGTISLYFITLTQKIMPQMMNGNHLFFKSSKIDPEIWNTLWLIALIIFSIWSLSYAFFKLKEKEI